MKIFEGPDVSLVINDKIVQLLLMLEINKLGRGLSINIRNEFQIHLSIPPTQKKIVCKLNSKPGKQSESPFNQIFWKALVYKHPLPSFQAVPL